LKLIIRTTLLALLGVAAGASSARADGWVSPFGGVNFGGTAGGKLGDAADDPSKFTWGVDLGGMFGGVFGAELDIAYTHDFFGGGDNVSGNHVLTVIPNLVVGIPIGGQHGGGIRPFVDAGIGLMKRDLSVNSIQIFDDNSAVYSLGAGVMGYFSDHFGIRGDYRYIRRFSTDNFDITNIKDFDLNNDTFNYSRLTFGAVFRF